MQTFLDEHPEWEEKWSKDREKARLRALGDGKQDFHKSRFDHPQPAPVNENDDNNGRSGSIRVVTIISSMFFFVFMIRIYMTEASKSSSCVTTLVSLVLFSKILIYH